MPSNLRRSFRYGLLFSVLFASMIALGQAPVRSPKASQPANAEEEERDNPAARQAWFLRGRIVPGKNAAALLHRAFQQKIALRKAQQQARQQAAPAGGPGLAGGPLPMGQGIGPAWTNLGPAPITSSSDGTTNFSFSGGHEGNFSGRVQAVVVDPNDSTGNTVYVGSAYGGVWKTTNGKASPASNVTWTSLFDTDPAASTLSVGAVAVLPCSGACGAHGPIVLVGTGEPDNAIDSYYGQGILRFDPTANAWSLISSADGGTHQFQGMGFSKIAFNTSTPAMVVAATGATFFPSNTLNFMKGLYYSSDSGATWSLATVKDGSTQICIPAQSAPQGCSVSDVVYDATNSTFYAAIRFHGFYSSTDNGHNWTRLTVQPGSSLPTTTCTPATNSSCPMYRGQLAVQPSTGDLYTVFVGSSGDTSSANIYRATFSAGVVNGWTHISNGTTSPTSTGIVGCGDGSVGSGCDLSQSFYNLYIAAVPNGTGTDLYIGAVNLFKCRLANSSQTCNMTSGTSNIWMNISHVYGSCSGNANYQTMHPDNHGFGFMVLSGGSVIAYLGNDGGVYRSLDSRNLVGGTNCSAGGPAPNGNALDSLNTSTLGSLTQFIWISTDPVDGSVTLGGTQDNGSPATAAGQSSPVLTPPLFFMANGGDGGYNFIDHTGNNWYTTNTGVSIQKCSGGIPCIETLPFNSIIGSGQVGGDSGAFYTPYMLDPANDADAIVGTCRVWRGVADGSALTALSFNFDTGTAATCNGSENNIIASLAAGGATSGGLSQVVYAGTGGGHIWATTNAAGGTGTWTDQTGSTNPGGFPVSGVAIDQVGDNTGQTAYMTIMGFTGGAGHVWKTTNAGTNWTDITGNLPDAPVNSVLVDPGNHNIVYVGTDVGVFMASDTTQGGSTNWQEWGLSFPNVAVLSLASAPGGKLRAGTHGRGIFETQLSSAFGGYTLPVSNTPQTVYVSQLPAVFNGNATATGSYNSPVNLSCTAGGTAPPSTCTPAPNPVTPVTGPGTPFTISTSDVAGDYLFNLHGVGTDSNSTTNDTALTLHILDFNLASFSTTTPTIPHGTAQDVTFQVTAAGSFAGSVTLSCS
ncbi:MAG TPA: hypothetical protein VEG08_08765, partial [Terriglobales bacterium]|nr:hypothetical protein [Terriglobales bacterium]